MSDLEQRLSQSERPVRTDNSLETLEVSLQGILSRCEEGDHRQKEALDCLETVRGRLEQLERITRELAEKQEASPTLPSPPSDQQQQIPPAKEEQSETETVTESKGEIEELKRFVSERVAGMKDLVSGPLSVIFDAVRSDDFVGEDNFLTFSKAAVYRIIESFKFNMIFPPYNCLLDKLFVSVQCKPGRGAGR